MPFTANVYFDRIRVSFNRQLIIDLLEEVFEKCEKDDWSELEKKQFDCFVKYIEGEYSVYLENMSNNKKKIFYQWFFDNEIYNEYNYINEIEKLFVERENDE